MGKQNKEEIYLLAKLLLASEEFGRFTYLYEKNESNKTDLGDAEELQKLLHKVHSGFKQAESDAKSI